MTRKKTKKPAKKRESETKFTLGEVQAIVERHVANATAELFKKDFTRPQGARAVFLDEFTPYRPSILRFGQATGAAAYRDKIWTSADGRAIKIKDMGEEHLRNTISYLQRSLLGQFTTVRFLSVTKNSLQALLDMLEEAERRGIKV